MLERHGSLSQPPCRGRRVAWQFWGCCLQEEWERCPPCEEQFCPALSPLGVWNLEGAPYVSSDGSAVPGLCHPALPLPGPAWPRPPHRVPALRVPSGRRCCCITVGRSIIPLSGQTAPSPGVCLWFLQSSWLHPSQRWLWHPQP